MAILGLTQERGRKMKTDKLIAFWEYEGFPYFLWGEVTEIDQLGRAKIKEYGNALFNPTKIVRWTEVLQVQLDDVKRMVKEYEETSKAMRINSASNCRNVFKFKLNLQEIK
jgi:hypothetical protein